MAALSEIPELAGAVVAEQGAHILLLSKLRLTQAQAAEVRRRLELRIPGVEFTVIDGIVAAVVVQP